MPFHIFYPLKNTDNYTLVKYCDLIGLFVLREIKWLPSIARK